MFLWSTFWQTTSTAAFLAVTGGLWAMYIRVLGHSEKIQQLIKDVAEQEGRLTGYDTRIRSIETTTARIDANVTELLRRQGTSHRST